MRVSDEFDITKTLACFRLVVVTNCRTRPFLLYPFKSDTPIGRHCRTVISR